MILIVLRIIVTVITCEEVSGSECMVTRETTGPIEKVYIERTRVYVLPVWLMST